MHPLLERVEGACLLWECGAGDKRARTKRTQPRQKQERWGVLQAGDDPRLSMWRGKGELVILKVLVLQHRHLMLIEHLMTPCPH